MNKNLRNFLLGFAVSFGVSYALIEIAKGDTRPYCQDPLHPYLLTDCAAGSDNGGARGADSIAGEWAKEKGIQTEVFCAVLPSQML